MTSAGKPGNGSPKPDEASVQAALLSPEICIVVVIRISPDVNRDESRRSGAVLAEHSIEGRCILSGKVGE